MRNGGFRALGTSARVPQGGRPLDPCLTTTLSTGGELCVESGRAGCWYLWSNLTDERGLRSPPILRDRRLSWVWMGLIQPSTRRTWRRSRRLGL